MMIRPLLLVVFATLAVAAAAPMLLAADPAPAATAAVTVSTPKNISVDDAEKLLKSDSKVIVLDVRTADEFKDGHIPGAKNIDFFSDDFAKQIAALDKSKTYLVHCAAGGRSAKACKVFEKEQLPSVYHLNEGFKAWEKAGKPIEK
jgi:rhodanese-related sulfurtransferase